MRRSIGIRIGMVFVAFLLLVFASGATGLWISRELRHDALLINLLGRQRTLSQRMTAEALQVVKGKNPAYRQPLHHTAHVLFRQNMEALLKGGEALYAEGRTILIPPVRDRLTRSRLEAAAAVWDEVHRSVHRILDADPTGEAAEEAMRTIELLSPVLLSRLDEVVQAYEAASRRKVQYLAALETTFAVLGLLTVAIGYLLVRRSVALPILLLKGASLRLAGGDFEAPLPPPSEDEIGSLNHAFGEMRTRLGRSMEEQAMLLAELEGRVKELTLLHDVTAAAAGASDLDEALHAIIREVKGHLGYEHLWILLCDGERLRVRAADETARSLILELPLGEGITGWVAQAGEPALLPDVEKDPRYRIGIPQTRSELCVPLRVGDRVIGVINAESPRPGAFNDHDLRLLCTIADEVSMVIERSRLHETTQRQLGELTSLSEISAALRAAATVQELASILSERAARLVRSEAAILCMVDETQEHILTTSVFGLPDGAIGRRHGVREGIAGHVICTNAIYRSPCLATDPLAVHKDLLAGCGPGVCVPLRTTEGQVVGTLLVARALGNATPFCPDEERLLCTLAEMGGNALQRASLFEQLEEAYLQAVVALSRAIDARDSATGRHSNRIGVLAAAVAEALGCPREDTETIWWGAILHDIGKLAVPDEILLKPGPLREEEWEVMRRHPVAGAEIVAPLRRLHRVVPLIRHHQERWDGTGYPDGLRGEEIPLGARILAVVDAYVAMTEDRPYRSALPHEEAMEELKRQAGKQFDPKVVEVFCQVIERKEELPLLGEDDQPSA